MDMEKIYLTMKRTGAGNIVLGILSICFGLASGIMLIVSGANLLKKKQRRLTAKISKIAIITKKKFSLLGMKTETVKRIFNSQ